MTQPDNPKTHMAPHGYFEDSDLLAIRFSRANLGFTHERIGPDLRVLRTLRGTIGGILINNASKKIDDIEKIFPISNPTPQDFDTVVQEQLNKPIKKAPLGKKRTIAAVEKYYPGSVKHARLLLASDLAHMRGMYPDSKSDWRKEFQAPAKNVLEDVLFVSWAEKLSPQDQVEVYGELFDEQFNERSFQEVCKDLTKSEALAYMTFHLWD